MAFWERLRISVAAFPPPAADAEFIDLLAQLGITAEQSPFADRDAGWAAALAHGQQEGQAMIDRLAGGSTNQERWSTAKHMFDYNLDRLGLGTINDSTWKIADRKKAYATRAVIARAGLWGNNGYEANYDFAWVDSDGAPLTVPAYEVTFSPQPPVKAFWSFTMYDTPRFYLVANPINRYSIGDRTPGRQVGDDGSVTIYLQHDSPGAAKESNWLPTPAGPFRPVLRTYQPGEAILDGSYPLPAIKRTSDRPA